MDDASDLLVIAIGWQNPEDVSSVLEDPDGIPVDMSNLRVSSQMTNHVWEVSAPKQGTYMLRTDGLTQEFFATASARSHYELYLFIGAPVLEEGNQGARVPILASFVGPNGPITGAIVQAEITDPAGVPWTMQLFDDGNHGDGEPNDGIYGGVFTATSFADVNDPPPADEESDPQGVGSYRVRVLAVKDAIQREAEGYFAVQRGRDSSGDGIPDLIVDTISQFDPADGDPANFEAFVVIPLVPFDTYDISVRGPSTLTNLKQGVGILSSSAPSVDMGTLLSGDAVPDEIINILDFGLLAGAFGTSSGDPAFNSAADFDANTVINISDFGLLTKNFLETGPVIVP